MAIQDVRVSLVALFSALGSFLFGLDIGYIAPILECASFKRDVVHAESPGGASDVLAPFSGGFLVAVFPLGCLVSCWPSVSGYFLDELGRRASIISSALAFLCGCALQAEASGLRQMLAGRFLAGMSAGLMSSAVVLYQSELAPAYLRGALTALYQLMFTFGILCASLVDLMLVQRDGGWRTAIWLQALPALVLCIGMIFMPRSPRWLVQQHRPQEALRVLKSLRASEEAALEELEEIHESCRAATPDSGGKLSSLQYVFSSRTRRPLFVGVTLALLQQCMGMSAFLYYGSSILGMVDASSGTSAAAATPSTSSDSFQSLLNLVNFMATLPALVLVESLGRRRLLLGGAAVMTLACVIMATGRPHQVPGDQLLPGATEAGYSSGLAAALGVVSAGGRARQILASVLFVAAYACSWGPAVWVYCSEIFPGQRRGCCMAVVASACWVGNFAVAQATPILLEAAGLRAFSLLALLCAAGFVFALWLPETQGLTLEQIEDVIDSKLGVDVGKPLASYGAVAARTPYRKAMLFRQGGAGRSAITA
eukprot:TRINITY_DN30062_c0_g1_i1.p1 TRINITY_DN30062_c0_g1~~TRINITY_DN30062_c0_g1_i1.p1  ORF type:complete len:540 (+),score=93.25 TRINITY_DN30062_c0_g1_i1:85-1704(+)